MTSESRSWEKVDIRSKEECWIWKAALNDGYGFFWTGKKVDGAHRFSLELKLGRELKKGEWSLHSCDNRPCVNPNHLFLGNPKANTHDSIQKGRFARGELAGISKLTEDEVLQIRNLYHQGKTAKELDEMFGIKVTSFIVKGLTWKHVGGPIQTVDMRKLRNGRKPK